MDKHSKEDFNLCANTHCQVYGGASAEDERSDKAVFETWGEIIVYNGEIVNTLYHSSCGGYTEDVRNVWHDSDTENPEYLSSVKCGFCEDDKWYNWSAKISFAGITNRLKAGGYKVGSVKKVKTVGNTASGRVKQILIEHSKGKLWLFANKFRMLMNPNFIRSTNFTVRVKNNIVYFQGHGWGHGVGMCQWGAKGMAEKGWDYKKILKYYYKGSDVEQYKE
jgi:stage II sporulation protein D